MLGSRIDPTHMRRTINRQTWWVMQPGTGSAWWYLALKNHVLGAGVVPKAAIVYFRDYNLTDVMFRLDATFRWSLDRVAGPEEPELNAVLARRRQGGWAAVHGLAERTYHVAPLMARADDRLSQWPAERLVGPGPRGCVHQGHERAVCLREAAADGRRRHGGGTGAG